jgi:hypothetical protein
MHKIICTLITLFILNTTLHAQGEADSMPKNLYRHYTGTIGNHKAVMDLRYGFAGAANAAGSSYYFTDEAGLNFFSLKGPQAYSHSRVLQAQVFPENIPLSQVGEAYSLLMQTIRFDLSFSHDSVTGDMFDPGVQGQLKIRLKEDHNNPLPFVFKHDSTSTTATGKKNETLTATATYDGIEPGRKMSEKDAVFIGKAVARFMGGVEPRDKEAHDLAHICTQSYLSRFTAAVNKGKKLDGSSFSGVYTLFPVYSDNGLLVLQQSGYQYDFDNAAYTDQSRYLNLDVKNKRALQLDDVLVRNNDALAALLEKAFRKKYQLEPGKKLKDLFITEMMPLTDNFILVNKGIIFSYSPAKIFREEEDITGLQEMRLFLTYDELGSMLQPEFKNRVGLK